MAPSWITKPSFQSGRCPYPLIQEARRTKRYRAAVESIALHAANIRHLGGQDRQKGQHCTWHKRIMAASCIQNAENDNGCNLMRDTLATWLATATGQIRKEAAQSKK